MRDSRRSAALDEATIRDVMWRFGKAREALDDSRFTTALDYIVESGELVKAMIERHGREFIAATPAEPATDSRKRLSSADRRKGPRDE